MKNLLLIILTFIFVTSCSKKEAIDLALSQTDYVKKVHSDYIVGERTITYESGKKVVVTIPKDTIPNKLKAPKNLTKAATILGESVEEPYEWEEQPGPEEFFPAFINSPMRLYIGIHIVRDADTRIILGYTGFYGYVTPAISEYMASTGEPAVRRAEVMGITGSVTGIPGTTAVVNYHCYVNATYTYQSGNVITRQYERSGTRFVW